MTLKNKERKNCHLLALGRGRKLHAPSTEEWMIPWFWGMNDTLILSDVAYELIQKREIKSMLYVNFFQTRLSQNQALTQSLGGWRVLLTGLHKRLAFPGCTVCKLRCAFLPLVKTILKSHFPLIKYSFVLQMYAWIRCHTLFLFRIAPCWCS